MMIRTAKRINFDKPATCTKAARFILLFLLQVFHLCGLSQKQNIRFTQPGKNAGMAVSNILCILQGSRGFMWFGTSDGLAKYDVYSYTFYKNDKNFKRTTR